MTKKELEQQIAQLKNDYVRIQGDLDKLESVGGNVANLEQSLNTMEEELAQLRKQLEEKL
ncbi:SE1832 family protein [Salirhabdus salicampi]|uniref:SE1832 family protein n=1 Tax=Salirhabdus salicampi TaxID=476102 RepID=UPI0020C4AF95|nr:SE1832 family protein [Salirhabdus salicampi]MCP8617364.1 SE1832 family protein [Salirhabdus salicampi]